MPFNAGLLSAEWDMLLAFRLRVNHIVSSLLVAAEVRHTISMFLHANTKFQLFTVLYNLPMWAHRGINAFKEQWRITDEVLVDSLKARRQNVNRAPRHCLEYTLLLSSMVNEESTKK